jgi:hypothetical protein
MKISLNNVWLEYMPLDMIHATSSFTKTMTNVFEAYMDKFLKVFVNNLNIHNLTWEEHLEHLHFVVMTLREVNIKLNPSKSEFTKTNSCF